MECRELRERLSDFQDGTLPDAVSAEVSRHLRACGGCAETARTLEAVRDRLRELPPVPAPPELLPRIRERVALELPAAGARRSASAGPWIPSRLKVPLQAAAVVLLFASVYWYRAGSGPPFVPKAAVAPSGVLSSGTSPASAPASPPAASAAPSRGARTAASTAGSPERIAGRQGISTLPPDTPEPKVRVWSRADLPAAPAVRAATDSERIVPGFPTAHDARRHGAPAQERQVVLDLPPQERDGAKERIADAARSLGGVVEDPDRTAPDGGVAVRVLLPERAVPEFLERLSRIGNVPPERLPAESALPGIQGAGTVAYTVTLRVR